MLPGLICNVKLSRGVASNNLEKPQKTLNSTEVYEPRVFPPSAARGQQRGGDWEPVAAVPVGALPVARGGDVAGGALRAGGRAGRLRRRVDDVRPRSALAQPPAEDVARREGSTDVHRT